MLLRCVVCRDRPTSLNCGTKPQNSNTTGGNNRTSNPLPPSTIGKLNYTHIRIYIYFIYLYSYHFVEWLLRVLEGLSKSSGRLRVQAAIRQRQWSVSTLRQQHCGNTVRYSVGPLNRLISQLALFACHTLLRYFRLFDCLLVASHFFPVLLIVSIYCSPSSTASVYGSLALSLSVSVQFELVQTERTSFCVRGVCAFYFFVVFFVLFVA